jgi:hypothetical protein
MTYRQIPPEKSRIAKQATDARWWASDRQESERGKLLHEVATALWRDLEPERLEMFRFGNLYSRMPQFWAPGTRNRHRASIRQSGGQPLNVAKSCTDTYVSLLTQDRPKVSFVTDRGSWKLQKQAKVQEKFIHGIMVSGGLYGQATQIAFDSAKFPFGAVQIFPKAEKKGAPTIAVDRVLPWELLLGDFDSTYGDPKDYYRVRSVDRMALISEFEEKKDLLATAGAGGFYDSHAGITDADKADAVVTCEAFHLPRFEGGDGRHTITCGSIVLHDEPWKHAWSPYVLLHRQLPSTGIFGLSLLKELAPIQRSINRLMKDIERAQALIVGHWFIENGSSINTGTIDDRIGGFIRFNGSRPEYNAPVTVASDVYAHLDRLYQRAFEIVGISQMSAQSQLPAGMTAGKAILTYADVQTERFKPCYELYQDWFIRCARVILSLARDIAEEHSDFEVKSMGKRGMTVIKASDALMEEHEFDLELYPTNAFADDPSARLEMVQDMLAANLVSAADAKRLLDMPDLDALADYENASYDLTMQMIDDMLETGVYQPPEPFLALEDSLKWVQLSYLKAKREGVEDARLDLLRRWMVSAQALSAPPPTPPMGGPASTPPGAAQQAGGPLGPAAPPPKAPPMVQAA